MPNGNVPDDLKELDGKICRLRGVQAKNASQHSEHHFSPAARMGVGIVADLLSGVLVGGGIGYVLDGLFNTKPFLLSVFLLFGGAAGFLNVYRSAQTAEKKKG